jgi:competence protein ComEC
MRPLIYIADVGQGNCNIAIVGKSPRGDGGNSAIVVDCGPKNSQDIPIALLRGKNVTWIEALVLTHNDKDHIGGLKNLLAEFKGDIHRIFYTGDRDITRNPAFKAIDDYYQFELENKDADDIKEPISISVDELSDGLLIFSEDSNSTCRIRVVIIAPTGHSANRAAYRNSPNDASAIVTVEYKNSKVIFSGDATVPSWESLLRRRKNKALKADAIIIPHHGGKIHPANQPGKLAWLYAKATRCKYALISAGSDNNQGKKNRDNDHPRKDVLRALYEANLKVVCTELTPNCSGCRLMDLKGFRDSQNPHHPSFSLHDPEKIACGGTIAIDMQSKKIKFLNHPELHNSEWPNRQKACCPVRM